MAQLNRIYKVLDYIHQNIDQTLTVEHIASQSCWSRWQLQRVFTGFTGMNVAQYIRELKLSKAAELLIHHPQIRIVDVAFSLGFNSEISFSRAFKQFFGQSPHHYRKQGGLTGVRQPIYLQNDPQLFTQPQLRQVRIEVKDSFQIYGLHANISGLLSETPNFDTQVPKLWQSFILQRQNHYAHVDTSPESMTSNVSVNTHLMKSNYGVVDTYLNQDINTLCYWAGQKLDKDDDSTLIFEQFSHLSIPKQTYAVLTHVGTVTALAESVRWLLLEWLPQSNYQAIDGYELEVYPPNYQIYSDESQMEYWLPIEPNSN